MGHDCQVENAVSVAILLWLLPCIFVDCKPSAMSAFLLEATMWARVANYFCDDDDDVDDLVTSVADVEKDLVVEDAADLQVKTVGEDSMDVHVNSGDLVTSVVDVEKDLGVEDAADLQVKTVKL